MSDASDGSSRRTSLTEIALLFLKLGATAFGGPAAHVALMQDEVVRRRAWLSDEDFLDLFGATNLIPGPNSTELAIHIGYRRRGVPGLVVAGASFIVPAMLATGCLAYAYVRYGARPEATAILYGVKPVIVAIIVQALTSLLPKAASGAALRVLGVLALVAAALGVGELTTIFLAGTIALLATRRPDGGDHVPSKAVALAATSLAGATAFAELSLRSIFFVFLKIGSVLFGSGYVLLAFLRSELVVERGWLSESQLLDAIAAGQITPGPVFSSATFVGYVLAGPSGALVATAGIFLPAFVFVALSAPIVPKLRASRRLAAFLDGVNVASLALMAYVTFDLARSTLIDATTIVLAISAAIGLIRFRLNSTWLIVAGALAGFFAYAR